MRHPPLPVMLFAAGFGTRMGALTADRPKPLIPVAGRALIDHALALCGPPGARVIVANAHYRAQMLRAHLSARPDVTVIEERPQILETGGGLRNALPALRPEGDTGPVITLNTDAVWRGPGPLALLEAAFDPLRMDALLLLVAPERARGHRGAGDFLLAPDGQITRGAGLIYTGAQVIAPDLLAALPDGPVSLNVAWNDAAARGRLFGLHWPGRWADVGHPAAIALAEDLLSDAEACDDTAL